MGRASRRKQEHRLGRTIRVWNDQTDAFETFDNVKVDDKIIAKWVAKRPLLEAEGYPHRPPELQAGNNFGWVEREGEAFNPLYQMVSLRQLVGWWEHQFEVEAIDSTVGPHGQIVFGATTVEQAVIKGGIELRGGSFRALFRVVVGHVGIVDEGERTFSSFSAAKAWLAGALDDVPGHWAASPASLPSADLLAAAKAA